MSRTEAIDRLADKYDPQLDLKVRRWLGALCGCHVDEQAPLCEILKTGELLCQAVNRIRPGTVATIHASALPFKQMENINSYLNACRLLHVNPSNMFQTVDLFESKNPTQVLNNIHNLAQICNHQADYHGPKFGTEAAAPAPSGPSLRAGNQRGAPRSVSPGTAGGQRGRGAPPRGRGGPPRGRGARGRGGPGPAPRGGPGGGQRGAPPSNGASGANPSPRGRGGSVRVPGTKSVPPQYSKPAATTPTPAPAPVAAPTPTPAPVPVPPQPSTKTTTPAAKKPIVFNSTLSFTGNKAAEYKVPKKTLPKRSWEYSVSKSEGSVAQAPELAASSSAPRVASVSSLEEDLATKQMFKYDVEAERSAVEWIEQVMGIRKPPGTTMHEWLKSGVILCRLLNTIKPGSVPAPSESTIAFKQRENIGAYLDACQRRFSIRGGSLFQTVDLYEEKDMNIVITSIHYLAKSVAKREEYKGPKIRQVVASADNVLLTSSFVNGLPPVMESSEISSEESELIAWINGHLKERNLAVTRLRSDLRDGVMLIRLLEILTSTVRLGMFAQRPANLWHAMQNASLILQFIQQQLGEKVTVCRGQELTTAQLPAIVALLQFIRAKFDREYVFKSQNLTVDSCRVKILEELLETEQTYVAQLRTLVQEIVREVKNNEMLPPEETWNLFSNIEEILAFNEQLLTELEERVQQSASQVETPFSDIFLSRNEFVPLYSTYLNNFDMAALMVKFQRKKVKPFKKLLKGFEKSQAEKTNGLELDSFLITPVQRMPRYLLLLKELAKYTPSQHPDYAGLQSTLEYLNKVLHQLNESKRLAEQTNTSHKILAIDKSMVYELEDFEGIVHPKRLYMYEGVLKWEDMEEEAENPYWFLFNDILVFCSDLSSDPDAPPDKQFRYITLMPLNFIDSIADNPDSELCFDMSMDEEIITLEANTVEEKNLWMDKIRQAKEEGAEMDLVW